MSRLPYRASIRHLGAYLPVLTLAASDASATSDAALLAVRSLGRSGSDTSATSDAAIRGARSAADTSATADSATPARGARRSATDTSATGDQGSYSIARTAADTSTTSDAASRGVSRWTVSTTILQPGTLGFQPGTLTAQPGAGQAQGDTSLTSDFVSRTFVANVRASADESDSSDAAARGARLARTGTDASATSDSVTRALPLRRFAFDTSATSDSALSAHTFGRSTADVSVTSDVARQPGRSAVDTSLTSDIATATRLRFTQFPTTATLRWRQGSALIANRTAQVALTGTAGGGGAASVLADLELAGWATLAGGQGLPAGSFSSPAASGAMIHPYSSVPAVTRRKAQTKILA